MSTLLFDQTVWVIKIGLIAKSGGGVESYHFGLDYWASGELYTSSPVIYPLLSAEPKVRRSVGVYAGIRHDVSVDLFTSNHLDRYGRSLNDLLEAYEIHGAVVEFRAYQKPISGTAGAHSDVSNIRQVCKVIDKQTEDPNGIMQIQCRDVWFKDKEISRKLSSTILTGLDDRWEDEYGSIVFGQSTVSGQGLVIDAPLFDSQIDGSNRPTAKIFSGWTFTTHPNNALQRVLVRNQYKDQDTADWVEVALESDPQTAGGGEVVSSPVADPPNWPRDLTRWARGVVDSPGDDSAKILTAVRTYLQAAVEDRCADMIDGQHFYNNNNPDYLSAGDDDLSLEIWVRPDTLHTAANRIIAAQGDTASGTLEWMLYFNTADDKFTFGISHNGTTIADSVKWSSGASTATWYQICCSHNEATNQLAIYVNNGTAVTAATTGAMTRRNGPFHIGANINGDTGYDGRLYIWRYWARVLTSGEVNTLYNGGYGVHTDDLDDSIQQAMRCSNMLNEPYGLRADGKGSADLIDASNNSSLSPSIGFAKSAKPITVSNSQGSVRATVQHAKSIDSGASYYPDSSPLREATIDLDTSSIQTGTSDAYFQISPPLVKAPNANYLTSLEMTNAPDESWFVRSAYEDNAGSTHYARNNTSSSPNWSLQSDIRFEMRFYYLGDGDDAWTDSTGGAVPRYSYQHLEGVSITLSNGQSHLEFNKDLDFKIAISGLEDNSAGDYTGSANAVIENPSDLIRFALMSSEFGLGLTSTEVDTSSLTTARTAYNTLGLTMQIVLDGQWYAEEFILEIARQARGVIYKTRLGKLALKVASPISSFSAILSEAFHRGDFVLESVADNEYSQVINDFRQYYNREILTQPNDLSLARRDPRAKTSGSLELGATASTSGDAFRESLCTNSQTLYGVRTHTSDLSFYDNATQAQKQQNYLADRYSTLQKRLAARVYFGDWYTTLDLFSNIQTQHTGIPAIDGTTDRAKVHYQGQAITCYSEGVPCVVWAGGSLSGQVYEVEEEGPWMTVTAETVSIF